MSEDARERLAAALAQQADWCRQLGSELYATILKRCTADAAAGGAVWRALETFAADSWDSALALRFMAGVHRLALGGAAPEVAASYPSCGGSGDAAAAADAVIAFVDAQLDRIRAATTHGLQTNEPARCAALLGGFAEIHRRTRLPLPVTGRGGRPTRRCVSPTTSSARRSRQTARSRSSNARAAMSRRSTRRRMPAATRSYRSCGPIRSNASLAAPQS